MSEDLCFWPAHRLAAAIRARQVSPVEVVEIVTRRIEAVNPRLNAYVTLDPDGARTAARRAEEALARGERVGPLHGVPVAVKDDLAVRGLRFTCGSNLLSGNTADFDHIAVERLRRAGAIILGKTNLPEFGHKGTTDNLLFGPTNNPWDPARVAGGSSGGSAAALAAGLAYLALGTDIGGSLRIPASCCGVVGHKPSLGRVPRVPAGNLFNLAWTAGPMARTVADVALGLGALAGPDRRDPLSLPPSADGEFALDGDLRGLRLGWSASPTGVPVEPEVAEAARQAVGRLEALGVEIVPVAATLPVPGRTLEVLLAGDSMLVFVMAGMASRWRSMLLRALGWVSPRHRLSPSFVRLAHSGFRVGLSRYIAAQKAVTDFVEGPLTALFEGIDVLATPTIALPPFPHPGMRALGPERVAGLAVDRHLGWFFTWPFNLGGQPAVSIPCGWTAEGLPIGLQLVGPRPQDGLVLRVAAALERLQPWAVRLPGVPAV